MLAAVKHRVKLARKLEKLELLTKRTNAETGWLQKAADEMDIILDENELYPFYFLIHEERVKMGYIAYTLKYRCTCVLYCTINQNQIQLNKAKPNPNYIIQN